MDLEALGYILQFGLCDDKTEDNGAAEMKTRGDNNTADEIRMNGPTKTPRKQDLLARYSWIELCGLAGIDLQKPSSITPQLAGDVLMELLNRCETQLRACA